ncbi:MULTISPECIES: MOSC domain-containing protein [Subtercola]|uniref:Molybdenum cofactor biosysynthesis protein n=1 Tax=Subtercola vilae TaxID=2056433 RepID=A0A4T2C4L6_9MICO|nr:MULTISPECIES: molybdenum cofactor biosysynthesis protein [Subtercola]MEA9984718.1 molybdenum cofactor biosysynthesis protein [Subtercola sp. RTI3]TIH39037.1 molybdenum cofactor biosysynthesis protein [Subtercola vilae]
MRQIEVQVAHLFVSPLHRYEGRPSDGPVPLPAGGAEGGVAEIALRAHLGVVGDRYFGREAHRSASVTVMAMESLEAVERELQVGHALDPFATRRTVFLRGADVDALARTRFSLDTGAGEVVFQGNRPANPCAWMNVALAEGAHRALRGRGGVRCEPLADGNLTLGPAVLRVYDEP